MQRRVALPFWPSRGGRTGGTGRTPRRHRASGQRHGRCIGGGVSPSQPRGLRWVLLGALAVAATLIVAFIALQRRQPGTRQFYADAGGTMAADSTAATPTGTSASTSVLRGASTASHRSRAQVAAASAADRARARADAAHVVGHARGAEGRDAAGDTTSTHGARADGPSPAQRAAIQAARDFDGGAGAFSRYYGWEDCKGWQVGIGLAASPLERPFYSTRVLGPDTFWSHVEFDAEEPEATATLAAADPFLVPGHNSSTWYIFFEMVAWRQAGVIAWATLDVSGLVETAHRLVETDAVPVLPHSLPESEVRTKPRAVFGGRVRGLGVQHASYPCVVRYGGRYYMTPQLTARGLLVFVATHFPSDWEVAAVVSTAYPAVEDPLSWIDSSLFMWKGHWYIFSSLFDSADDNLPTRHIFTCTDRTPAGEWHYHPSQPQFKGDIVWLGEQRSRGMREHFARNAGRVVPWGEVLVRPTQWYRTHSIPYGPIARAAVITRLSPHSLREVYDPQWVVSLSRAAEDTPSGDEYDDGDSSEGSEGGSEAPDPLDEWDAFGAHHVDYQRLPSGLFLVALDGRESCERSRSRINHRCVYPLGEPHKHADFLDGEAAGDDPYGEAQAAAEAAMEAAKAQLASVCDAWWVDPHNEQFVAALVPRPEPEDAGEA